MQVILRGYRGIERKRISANETKILSEKGEGRVKII